MKVGSREKPEFYMELAVEAMRKSIVEKGNSKPSPHVGAVLVFPDGTYETAYRGEFREGDHAEYTVMDKKCRDKDLTDCWLFATLEPCAPGVRNKPKFSCSERIVNARISKLWFGIEDPNPKVDHAGIDYMIDHEVEVNQFSPEYFKEIEVANNKFFKWAENENQQSKKKTKAEPILEKEQQNYNLNDLSSDALEKFNKLAKYNFDLSTDKLNEVLRKKGLFTYDDKKQKYIPTVNAILLFGKRPCDTLEQACVKAKVKYFDGTSHAKTFDKALVLIPDELESWVRKVLPETLNRSNFKAKSDTKIPIEAIREAYINAIAHRDYDIEGAKVQIEVLHDRIIVRSPGKPPLPVTIEKLKDFTATSYSRNKKITNVFNQMEYMEESQVGMDTFKELRETYKLPLPIFKYNEPYLETILFTSESAMIEEGPYELKNLNKEELIGFDFIKSKGEVSRKEYQDHFGFERKKASNQLKKMKVLGLITDNGLQPTDNGYKYVYLGKSEG